MSNDTKHQHESRWMICISGSGPSGNGTAMDIEAHVSNLHQGLKRDGHTLHSSVRVLGTAGHSTTFTTTEDGSPTEHEEKF